ncbi:hypothetical protein [Brevibacillus sp. SYSU BS000544]|uniref:hypothetical protein n=1 Tax=Brevibacillus sp. SYSU BS000544 TaxID=3416443 RepID=UPI003CE59C5E
MEEILKLILDEFKDVKSDIKEMKTDIKVMKTDIKVMKSEIKELQTDVKEMKGEIIDMKREIKEIKQDQQQHMEMTVQLIHSVATLNGRIEEQNDDLIITKGIAMSALEETVRIKNKMKY